MKSKKSRKRSHVASSRMKVEFENKMVTCIKSLKKEGEELEDYLENLESDTYGSDIWRELTKLLHNTSRSRTIEDHLKLDYHRFRVWSENIYHGLGVEKKEISRLQSSKKQVKIRIVITHFDEWTQEICAVAGGCVDDFGRVPLDLDIWIKRSSFPPNFPKLESTISGFSVKMISWESLRSNKYIDDIVVNAYLRLVCSHAQSELNVDILPLDVHLVHNIIFYNKLGGYMELMEKIDLKSYKIILFPINDGNEHWTLLVAMPNLKLIIYLDSKHGEIDSNFVNRICSFLQVHWQPEKRINFKKWILFTPKDIPTQFRRKGTIMTMTMNCGPHLLAWSHNICCGKSIIFDDKHMDSVRRRVAEILLTHDGFQNQKLSDRPMEARWLRNHRDKSDIELPKKEVHLKEQTSIPILGYSSTYELCASLHKL
ncbi:hypothetical protein QAD02_013555 [Eretmocerus hayati]|uniref:Uncharacterized protein n=1 Tax=Eretmocerus hayati TaxID=131215 RepID=A0ACC2P2R7_9HYME|nr:hypothetical protein QAD02_013555 [Eretmocerus hayati]